MERSDRFLRAKGLSILRLGFFFDSLVVIISITGNVEDQENQQLEQTGLTKINRLKTARTNEDFGLLGVVFEMYSCKKPIISNKNCKARVDFAKNHLLWGLHEWSKVL